MKRIVGAGGGGGGGCFLGHTLVRTPDGQRAIETLQPGDLVVSFDDQGQLHHAKILKVHVHEGERVVRYRLWGGAVLDATPNHWVLNQFNAFVEIGSLGSDDCLVDENSHLRPIVASTEFCVGTVYNLTVEGHHTFIAGGIRVHNAGLGLGITGAGGGGGGGKGGGGGGGNSTPYTPSEARDNLASNAYVNIVDVLGEGEIQGFATPERNGISKSDSRYGVEMLKDVFVNNTPVVRSAATILAATYTQTATTITVTYNAHGFGVRSKVVLSVNSGLAASGTYTITAVTANTFTAASKNDNITSGTLAIARPADYNFKNFNVYTRYGTANQTYIPGFGQVESEQPVGVVVENGVPIVRTITNPEVDAVRVSVTVPQLQQFQNNGDITGSSVKLQIQLSENGSGFYTAIENTIKGRSADAFQRDYEIALTGKAFPIDVRLVRVSADSASAKIINAFNWASYTEIINARLSYPNTAYAATRISAEQFSSIPTRAFRIRGRKVAIPSNATVDLATGALIYSGVWDGTFAAATWTSDPAWCLWDLLTNYRFGFGDQLNASQLDKWAFYSASIYSSALNTYDDAAEIAARAANGLAPRTGSTDDYNATTGRHGISDGRGGYEPRFSCNVNLQTQEEAYKLINDLCSVFRVMPYWATGALTISQDAPADPSYLFTLANVTEDGFVYSASSQKTKPTVVLVSYLDLNLRELAYEQVEDQPAIRRLGVVTQEISAFACTSRSQARRLGEWFLYSNNYEGEVVAFTANIDAGVVVRPGQIINIADPMRAGTRRGGRISSATVTTVTVDSTTGLPASGGTLSAILPDGTVETRTVSGRSGSVVTVTPAFSAAPNPNSVWIYENSSIEASTWRVISVSEKDQSQYSINAVSHNSSKYDYVERDQPLDVRDVSNLNEPPDAPTDLRLSEELYTYQAEVRAKIIATWAASTLAASYLIRWRKSDGNWEEATSFGPDYEILNITPGTFEIEVFAVNSAGTNSNDSASGLIEALGKTAPPSDVTNFSAVLDPDIGVTLTWDPVSDLDIQGYEIWEGTDFGVGTKIGVFAATAKKLGLLPTGTITWFIKALDTSGVHSANATSTELTIYSAPASTLTGAFDGENYVLTWTPTSGDLATDYYEIRFAEYNQNWTQGTAIGTVKGTSFSFKANWVGVRRFFVAAFDAKGNMGAPAIRDVNVLAPSQPSITQQVVDNNVLLRWNDCTRTLPISAYELRRGTTWAGATVIGTKKGEFTSVFETVSGNYTYWLAGIDSAGNYGTPGSVFALVNQPPDYVLDYDQDSSLAGTKVNTSPAATGFFAPVNTTETWQDHFTTRSWTTLQDQVNAGFAYYGMPTPATASYEETIDFGVVLAGTKVTSAMTYTTIGGTPTVTPTISVRKTTSDPWTDYAGLDSVYATDFRYAKIKYDFASSGDDLIEVTRLNVKLDKKIKNDAGNGTANSGDVGGTTVNFNVAFTDVESISVTPTGTTPRIAVYDFVDAPNPTSFKVLLFDTSGNRVSGGFSWAARGA